MKYAIGFALMVLFCANAQARQDSDRSVPSVATYDTYNYITETCIDGVMYLVKSNGITVKYNRASKVVTCQPDKEKTE